MVVLVRLETKPCIPNEGMNAKLMYVPLVPPYLQPGSAACSSAPKVLISVSSSFNIGGLVLGLIGALGPKLASSLAQFQSRPTLGILHVHSERIGQAGLEAEHSPASWRTSLGV